MSEIYLYCKSLDFKIVSEFCEIEYSRYKSKWICFILNSSSFSFHEQLSIEEYSISKPGKYAIYRKELIEVQENSRKILLVSDLDKTLFYDSSQGLQAYHSFLRHWIRNFEFNGSVLVYNTGRSIVEYELHKKILYEPDLLVSVFGNFAYEFDQGGESFEDLSYKAKVKQLDNYLEWDSAEFLEEICEKFSIPEEYIQRIDNLTIVFNMPDEFVVGIAKEFREFVRNKAKEVRKGRCFQGKFLMSRCNMTSGYYVEILPKYTGKHLGVNYAQERYRFKGEDTLVAGDSIHDKCMFKCDTFGVIVGNADKKLKEWALKESRSNMYFSPFSCAEAVNDALALFAIHGSFNGL